MIVTKKQQESLVESYAKENPSTEKHLGFIDGILKTLELVDKLMKKEKS